MNINKANHMLNVLNSNYNQYLITFEPPMSSKQVGDFALHVYGMTTHAVLDVLTRAGLCAPGSVPESETYGTGGRLQYVGGESTVYPDGPHSELHFHDPSVLPEE